MARSRSVRTALAELLDSATALVYVLDQQRRIVYCNSACAAWIGATAEQVIGLRCDYHSKTDLGRAPAIAAGLCPPPEVFAGTRAEGVVAALGESAQGGRRRARFEPLGSDTLRCVGVIAVVDDTDLEQESPLLTGQPSEPVLLHQRIGEYRAAAQRHYHLDRLVGDSPEIKRVREQVAVAAASQVRVVLVGPKGSGREHVARTIHFSHKPNSSGSLIPLDCTLLDSELLQSTVSSFVRRWAEVERDQLSALLLLEVDRLDAEAQRDLIGFLDIREFGLRTLATASRSLLDLAREGKFRRDLAYALSPLVIDLPGLDQRAADLPLLAQLLLEDLNAAGQRQLAGFAPEAMDQLVAYHWPGNLDELVSAVRAAHQQAEGPLVQLSDLPQRLSLAAEALLHPPHKEEAIELDALLRQIEWELVTRALDRSKGNRARAARLLGISRPRLLRLIAQRDPQK